MEGTSHLPWALERLHGEVQGLHSRASDGRGAGPAGGEAQVCGCEAAGGLASVSWLVHGRLVFRQDGWEEMVDREAVWAGRV